MIYEVSLWLNPGSRYNGNVNINRGEQQIKIPRLVDCLEFQQSVGVETEDLEYHGFDPKGLYALLPGGHYVCWNPRQDWCTYFDGQARHQLRINKTITARNTRSKSRTPDVCFRSQV